VVSDEVVVRVRMLLELLFISRALAGPWKCLN